MLLPTNDRMLVKLRSMLDFSTECWLFTGNKNRDGYGVISFGSNRQYLAHRVAAAIYLGLDLLDHTKLVLHKLTCPNKHCCNPEHLYIGSRQDNVNDAVEQGTQYNVGEFNKAKTHCPQGHEYTEENTGYSNTYARYCKMCKRLRQRVNNQQIVVTDDNGNRIKVDKKYLQ